MRMFPSAYNDVTPTKKLMSFSLKKKKTFLERYNNIWETLY